MGLIGLPMGHPLVNHPVFSLIPLNWLGNLYNSFSSESEKYTSDRRRKSGKVYVKQSYWGKKHKLNMWINYHMILMAELLNSWGMVGLDHSWWGVGDRFMVQCKGSFQCSNPHCPHVVQYNRFDLWAPIPQNGQTHSDNSSANCRRIVWFYLIIFWNWGLKI